MKILISIITILLVLAGAYVLFSISKNEEDYSGSSSVVADINEIVKENGETGSEIDEAAKDQLGYSERTWITNLKDVIEGKTIGLTTFKGDSGGSVVVTYIDGSYNLEAIFLNLPKLDPTYFYEGWVVKQGADMSVISTGEAILENDTFTNTFYSPQNLTDHTFYVLTVEPRDNNPKPADHVLEGILVLQ
jgi:hypothetical protein